MCHKTSNKIVNNEIDYKLFKVPIDTWCNICITMNNNVFSVYLNGELKIIKNIGLLDVEKINSPSLKNIYILNNSKNPSINENTKFNYGFPGYLNDFNYYNNIISPKDIKDIYNNYLPQYQKIYELMLMSKYNTNGSLVDKIKDKIVIYDNDAFTKEQDLKKKIGTNMKKLK